jgi:hypothetical protein
MLPDQRVDIKAMTKVSLRHNRVKCSLITALVYKLQRKNVHESSNQSGTDNIADISTGFQLLIIWLTDYYFKFRANAILIKHNNTITWDDDKLRKVHFMYLDLIGEPSNMIETTWLLDDTTALVTTPRRIEEGCTLEITISEGTRKDDSIEPLWVPSDMSMTDDGV